MQARHVLWLTAAITVGTFAVRLWLPARGSLPGDLHLCRAGAPRASGGLPPLVKAVTVRAVGVVAAFSLGWLLVSRTRPGRIL